MSRITRGCHRVSIDFPLDLYEKIKGHADAPPAIAFGEWVRRICAHRVGYDMKPAAVREEEGLTLVGDTKRNGENGWKDTKRNIGEEAT